MGSIQIPVIQGAADILDDLGYLTKAIVSAHRTPHRLVEFAENAHKEGVEVVIAGAGGAAHLPGMVTSISPLPVIGFG